LRVERWVLFSRSAAALKRMQGCQCCRVVANYLQL
jgi:hypothetical protein